MVLKTKLSLGLGFLFLIIFVVVGLCAFFVQKLSQDGRNVLKNNYDSLVYAKNMSSSLEDMLAAVSSDIFNSSNENNPQPDYFVALFEAANNEFEKNLKAENNNITEIHEKEYVDSLNLNYNLFLGLCMQVKKGKGHTATYFSELIPAFTKIRQLIDSINDVNMQAVVRKNNIMETESSNIVSAMAITGTICVILAFGYFWYFPFYVSNSISYLSSRMKELLRKIGLKSDITTKDESFALLNSIELLEKNLDKSSKEKKTRAKK
jgi:NtrC-family two-component system sensor histidine kinase KinB